MSAASVPVEPSKVDTGLTDVASRLRLALGQLERRIRMDSRDSPLRLAALAAAERHGPLRPSELAAREAVSASTMSRVLAALDGQGLIVRATDPQDGRGVLVTVSEAGRSRLEEIRSQRTAFTRRLARLDPGQRAAIRAALAFIEALLDD